MTIITKLDNSYKTFFQCGCTQEILLIEYDHDIKAAFFAIYETNASLMGRLSLWQRLRYCVRCLFTGFPYNDQIVLDNKQLNELKTFLGSLDI